MPSILDALRFSAQNLDFLPPVQLERRAKLVEADFAKVGLDHKIGCFWYHIPGQRARLPYGYYELVGSECSIHHAGPGDRRHVAMSGGGLNQECILYYSKVSEWAHANIPHLWPMALRSELRDANQHLNTVCEMWWLMRVVGADYATVQHSVLVDPTKPSGKNFDWQVQLPRLGITFRMEIKRRLSDMGRSIDVPHLKQKSTFHDLEKFPPANPPDELNVACIRLFAPVSSPVRLAAKTWLSANPNVSAIVMHAPSLDPEQSFVVIAQPKLEYISTLLSQPDSEDNTYIAPFTFARDIPGLNLPKIAPTSPASAAKGKAKPLSGRVRTPNSGMS
ncbi:hypothetical protein OH491_26850 [Termitidicoccus mucosus]|uniref:Uncharacterized protein n=1 Tax=Termitidicoccus mucosus TaxID=1184151 RepID=A0A178IBB0_9BACT|nr:hypothetical protein AW736_23915 [Opitutaceae bacterium TSB47]